MIYSLISILLAAVPSVILVLYFLKRDKLKREPRGLVVKTFLFGFLAVLPAAVIEMIIEPYFQGLPGNWYHFAHAFAVAALVEETLKLYVVWRFVFRKPDFDEMTDGIIYLICASMGFAFFENIFYGFGEPGVILLRAFTAVPLHAVSSGIMGYYLALSKFGNRQTMGRGLLIAIIIHGLYDFFLFTGTWLAVLVIPLLIVCIIWLLRLFKKAQELDRDAGRMDYNPES
jgi:protease PrsW